MRSNALSRVAFALLPLLAWHAPRAALAGESFLDRNAGVHEAVPYGRSIDEEPPPTAGARTSSGEEEAPGAAEPPGGSPSGPIEPGPSRDPGSNGRAGPP
jgi:hypothetical protein